MIFGKDEVAQSNGDILGCFLFKQIYYIFTSIGTFETWLVAGILRFQKWFELSAKALLEIFWQFFSLETFLAIF
jgi:hypothetical protein